MNSTIKPKTGKCIDCPEGSPDKVLIAKRCANHYRIFRMKVSVVKKAGKDAAGGAAGGVTKILNPLSHLPPLVVEDVWVTDSGNVWLGGTLPTIKFGQDNGEKWDTPRPAKRFDDEFPKIFDKSKAPPAPRSRIIPKKPPKPLKRTPKKTSGTKAWYEYHIQNCKSWICQECRCSINPSWEHGGFSCQAHILPKEHFPSVKNVLENHLLLGAAACSCHKRFDNSWHSASRMNIFPLAYKIVTEKLIHLLSPQELSRLPEVFTKPLKIESDGN